jgi:hypothetical protein
VLFLPGSFGHLGFACAHKPAALSRGVHHDGERRLSSSTVEDHLIVMVKVGVGISACCAPVVPG